jgi:hypothetical protein
MQGNGIEVGLWKQLNLGGNMKRLLLAICIALFALPAFSKSEYLNMKLYLAPQRGTGTEDDEVRSILNDLIDITQGDWFDERDNPARRISICSVHASEATHNNIITDGRSVLLTPIDITSQEQFQQVLDTPFSSWPVAWRTAAQNGLEANGISVAWVTGTNTLREVLRYLQITFILGQMADIEGNANLKAFLARNLTATVGSLTAQQRNAAKTWIALKGLDSGWITNATTVRQVLHYVVENLGWGRIRFEKEIF